MALVAFWALIVSLPFSGIMYALNWIDAAYISAISGIAISVMTAIAGIIMTYIGAATYDDVKKGE